MGTPTGVFTIWEEDGALVGAHWGGEERAATPLLLAAEAQVRAYFAGDLTRFDLPTQVAGTGFQERVCAAIADIPFGQTRTYGDLARDLDCPAQAIGQGCGGNPIPLIIPCHRVLGATGLGGFSGGGGVETKVALLRHEGAGSLLL